MAGTEGSGQLVGGAALILSVLSAPEPDSWAQGIAWQGVWVLIYCLDGPEHPEKQGDKASKLLYSFHKLKTLHF